MECQDFAGFAAVSVENPLEKGVNLSTKNRMTLEI